MNNYLNKISQELLNLTSIQSGNKEYDCVVYASNYLGLKREAHQRKSMFIEFPFIKAIGIRLDYSEIIRYAKITSVSFISKQTHVFAQIDLAQKIVNMDAKMLLNGKDVNIAVIDTGVQPHLDLCLIRNRIVKFVDLIGGKTQPYDDNGHGTFVSSIACGSGIVSGQRYKGFAPKSGLIAIKALEGNGESGTYKILEAMQWIADNHKKNNIRVVCMSFGSNPLGKNDPLIIGAEALWDMGIVVVVACGNNGPESSTVKSPGFSPKVITVGALDDGRGEEDSTTFSINPKAFKVASFSSRGPAGYFYKPDLLAPGVNITSSLFDNQKNTFYTKMSGTSVATPMVAGICAGIISKYPAISPDQLKIRLLRSCHSIGFSRNDEGYGVIDLNMLFK